MITTFKLFEQTKNNQDWKLILDISTIWKDTVYQNSNELLEFNTNFINFLNQQKDLIIQNTSEESWNKLQELVNRLNNNKEKINESCSTWDDIYDWGDSNFVQIKAKNEIKKDF